MKTVLGLMILLVLENSLGQVPSGRDTFCVCSGHQVGDLVPDCDDCTGYYLCGNGVSYRRKCNPGEKFDGASRSCVWGQCPSSDETCTGRDPEISSTSTTTTLSPPGPCNTTDVICSLPGQILPDAQHCRFFYTCQDTLCPALGFCEKGMWFDRELFVCDYPHNVKNCPANKD